MNQMYLCEWAHASWHKRISLYLKNWKKEYVCAASIKRIETNELELIKTTAEGKKTATQKKIKKDILEIGGNIPV